MKYLPNLNRSALISAILLTTVSISQWAIGQHVDEPELRVILREGVLAIGIALGVVSNSRVKA